MYKLTTEFYKKTKEVWWTEYRCRHWNITNSYNAQDAIGNREKRAFEQYLRIKCGYCRSSYSICICRKKTRL